MSDESGFDAEVEEGEGGGITIDMGESPPVYVIEGQNFSLLFANPAHVAHPFYWIRDCIGCTVYSKPGSQQPDEIKFLIKVGDGIEERAISEVFHHESTKDYTVTKKLKAVH